eukprot:808141-Prorocentrum_minimum.AAC.1
MSEVNNPMYPTASRLKFKGARRHWSHKSQSTQGLPWHLPRHCHLPPRTLLGAPRPPRPPAVDPAMTPRLLPEVDVVGVLCDGPFAAWGIS